MSLRRPTDLGGRHWFSPPKVRTRMSRSLSGKDGQKIAGHANEGIVKNYQRDQETVRSEAIPDPNISEITG